MWVTVDFAGYAAFLSYDNNFSAIISQSKPGPQFPDFGTEIPERKAFPTESHGNCFESQYKNRSLPSGS